MITIQIIVKNDLLNKTLESIKSLNGEVLISDSEDRNALLDKATHEWNLWLSSGEILLKEIKELSGDSYFFSVINGDLITKEVRLFKKSKFRFENPVFELIKSPNAIDSGIYIFTENLIDVNESMKKVQLWKKEVSIDPYYYEAFLYLMNKEYDLFIKSAEKYMISSKELIPLTMIRYYYAGVQAYIKDNAILAGRVLLSCIEANPLMSEFWSLLGDIYYHNLKKYKKALEFYENAIILGSKRPKSDRWPVQISKYKDYPESMISSCRTLISSTESYII